MKHLCVIIIVFLIAFAVIADSTFAVSKPSQFSTDKALGDNGAATGIANKILSFIQLIAYAVALGMMLFIGIKYMLAGAGEKAQIKTTFLPYLVGAVCVGAAATLATFFLDLGKTKVTFDGEEIKAIIEELKDAEIC